MMEAGRASETLVKFYQTTTELQPRRQPSSYRPQWEPQILRSSWCSIYKSTPFTSILCHLIQFSRLLRSCQKFCPRQTHPVAIRNTPVFCRKTCYRLVHAPNRKTTPCRDSTITYTVYSQLPSTPRVRSLKPQPEDAPWRRDKESTPLLKLFIPCHDSGV
jgi:hypothetical protein